MKDRLKPGDLKRIIDQETESYDNQTGNGDPDINFALIMKRRDVPNIGLVVNVVRELVPPEAFMSKLTAYKTALALFVVLKEKGLLRSPEPSGFPE